MARKFAESDYHRALALSHLARSSYALHDYGKAISFAKSATDMHSETAKFWYELACYNVPLGRADESISALKEAIERDWTYCAVVSSDPDFDSIRENVNKLLGSLRDRERGKARKAIDDFKQAIETAEKAGVSQLESFRQSLARFKAECLAHP